MEEILREFGDKYGLDYPAPTTDKIRNWLKEKLLEFEKRTKEEFLKMIFPEFERSEDGKYDDGFNDCREEILTNASKEGVNIK
jgi:hypothetical protein